MSVAMWVVEKGISKVDDWVDEKVETMVALKETVRAVLMVDETVASMAENLAVLLVEQKVGNSVLK